MRWWHRFPRVLARHRPQTGRAWPGPSVRPDLTARAEASVDGTGPGRQASGTCPPTGDPATAETVGRSTPAATARDPRWPTGHASLSPGNTRPGASGRRAGRCLPRQAGRPIGRQAGRQPRPAGAPAGPGGARRAGQRRNIPAGVNRD